MTGSTDEKLVQMANQIARNLAREDDPVTAVADHIRAYWSRRMIDGLLNLPNPGLDPVALQAVARLSTRVEAAGS